MDELKVKSEFMKRVVSVFLGKKLVSKIGVPLSLDLHHLDAMEDDRHMYRVRVDCDIWISKEDLKKLIWKDQNGCGTS